MNEHAPAVIFSTGCAAGPQPLKAKLPVWDVK